MRSEAIDFLAASESFGSKRKLKLGDLRTLGMLTLDHGRLVPTVGGLLLFGKDWLGKFPDAYLRAGCFAGTDKTTIVDSTDITSCFPAAVDEALAFDKRSTRRSIGVGGARNAETWEYPLVAVREAVVNAMVHADYGQRGWPLRLAVFRDRIQIDNPGGLPAGLAISDIRQGVSKLRNRVLGRVFHALGLIEQWGSGIQRMTNACLQPACPNPSWKRSAPASASRFVARPQASPPWMPSTRSSSTSCAAPLGYPPNRSPRRSSAPLAPRAIVSDAWYEAVFSPR
ncbi:MAG: hypothetical protein JXP73_20505 [Deltaproteobacteria bacterium]|nr:hypothetical protein [Deltaproteobacteria bacterium]